MAQSLSIKVQAGMEMQMRSKLFGEILEKKYNSINKYHSGELMNRITSDIRIITDGITNIVPNVLYFITQFASTSLRLYNLTSSSSNLPGVLKLSFLIRKLNKK